MGFASSPSSHILCFVGRDQLWVEMWYNGFYSIWRQAFIVWLYFILVSRFQNAFKFYPFLCNDGEGSIVKQTKLS